ncbi:hypothetical protein POM88_010398 [Heracleum sosnowskyi]|uniref:Late embryogenesis abundant protein LEA-2 subgroup domain-containing protein n=1 Tax=Heracleum sosnowskyi TaxID=360622 RepID=A0AAD8ISJ0_9APIA|nr:hypothetical protein POM88_010398 [Heracleum sosnowskyi]
MVQGSKVAGKGDAISLYSSNLHPPFVALLPDCSRLTMAEQQLEDITVVNPQASHSEMSQQPTPSKKKKWWKSSWFLCIVISFFVKLVVVVLLFGIFFKYTNPRFQIDNVHVKTSPFQYPDYDITLKSRNENDLSTIIFDKEGNASLFSGRKEIAKGKYPQFKEVPQSSHDETMTLHGSTVLPQFQASMNIANVRVNIPLYLSIDIPMTVKLGALKDGRRDASRERMDGAKVTE